MQCYVRGKEERAKISKVAEEKIATIMREYQIVKSSSWGLDANSDGGLHDMHYDEEILAFVPEDFIVEGDEVVGYCYENRRVEFGGRIEVELDSWDYSTYGGAEDDIDSGDVCIEKKK